MHVEAQPTAGRPAETTVLIADDDEDWRALLRDFLEQEGFRVLEAVSAQGLDDVVAAWRPHIIVLDDRMPVLTGLECLPHLRRRFPEIPVVMMTAFGGGETARQALALGAAGYLDKPFRVARLVEEVRRLTRAREAGRSV